ncbi:tyrosyl-DNA phosphodiesterase [Histoplasma capsulatum G186AR]|uniref:Tyrosyl-DNA phosphodiesterase n=1 Tax=Ajellomyces capsulatus (strain G186AR / H82 / ATCC MYA-2454 / RMSCC 2432) TaxID=447093 RepID=C0NXE2_AJECG|nr:tyrosyl-DNA phosphodiesterase [Histoplasma capsulatum G186AR]EEH04008.1 tyrosyl-DNA phosphodiesterase [Histoplasma capsulatum G186AR]
MADKRRPSKRIKTSHGTLQEGYDSTLKDANTLASLRRSITPPLQQPTGQPSTSVTYISQVNAPISSRIIPSPIQLTHIRDFAASSGYNTDSVKLRDILGDPLIKECWQFNYMFDVDFLMSQFDEDVRDLVKVKIIHGSWKRESPNRIRVDEACHRYPNVEPIVAYMPEPFGTHHSKMMILIRHDDQAQVVIHTANMIAGDWANMCQAVWRSPLLPMRPEMESGHASATLDGVGRGNRFKRDLLAYLEAYGNKKTGPLVDQLEKYDFGAVRAGLIASVPTRQAIDELDSEKQTLWGWPALKDTIQQIPLGGGNNTVGKKPQIIIQISSVATLGQTDKWLKETFFAALSPSRPRASNLFNPKTDPPTKFSIIFPTPDEIRRSLNGYASGGSIHMKLQSAAQRKQLEYLRPYLCRWASDTGDGSDISAKHSINSGQERCESKNVNESVQKCVATSKNSQPIRNAGRCRAAPHIKTYIRFSDANLATIDWAMVTSANLSVQAWGAAANGKKEIRICSWEIGVLVWPDLFIDREVEKDGGGTGRNGKENGKELPRDDGNKNNGYNKPAAVMLPCFKQDMPEVPEDNGSGASTTSTFVGLRMPYDLPLTLNPILLEGQARTRGRTAKNEDQEFRAKWKRVWRE